MLSSGAAISNAQVRTKHANIRSYRLMRSAENALPTQSTATTGKIIDVSPVRSMKPPIRGSPNPAHAYDMKLRRPVAVPERRRPKMSGQSAQNDDAGPNTKNPQRKSPTIPSRLPCGTNPIAIAMIAARTHPTALARSARTVTLKRLRLRDGHVQRYVLCRPILGGMHHQYYTGFN
jgi:hypothetical protein